MTKLKTYAKRIPLNRFEHACFLLSPARKSLFRMFESYSLNDDLFNFAAAHFGIGQNRDEFLRFLTNTAKLKPQVICEIGGFVAAVRILCLPMRLDRAGSISASTSFCSMSICWNIFAEVEFLGFLFQEIHLLCIQFKWSRSVSGGIFSGISCS